MEVTMALAGLEWMLLLLLLRMRILLRIPLGLPEEFPNLEAMRFRSQIPCDPEQKF